ncbi:hypothetical protein V5799_024548 [Amblyomma americanum]|uniref:Uncharacterized protein n=1 Tax=Amblyomma americanum TaxID=6943 RepID=A0AAQ4EC29_AMBAM
MGRRQVWCVFGTFQQDYSAIDLARACDFAFIPLYTRAGQDTLLDDSHADVQKMLAMVHRFPNTSFAISFPHGRIADVMAHLRGSPGRNKLQSYWSMNIFHHAVLDLEVKPWQNRSIQNEVSAVFNLLRYCNDPMKLYLNFSIMADETAYAVPPNFTEYLSVFEVIYTATLKLCEVRRRYGANVSLALFDIECEDWRNACDSTDSQVVAGTNRIRRVYEYSERLTDAFLQNDPFCP